MPEALLNTGIDGLDEILGGGLISRRFYIVRGGPGTGKTTLGLHFLLEGVKNEEKLLLISMTEDIEKIKENARQYSFNLHHFTTFCHAASLNEIKLCKQSFKFS